MGKTAPLRKILARTTLPGLTHSLHSSGTRSRFWLCIGVVGLTLTTLQVAKVTLGYFSYPFSTKVPYQHLDERTRSNRALLTV